MLPTMSRRLQLALQTQRERELPLSSDRWLAVLRMITGAFWLVHGIPKFNASQYLAFMTQMPAKLAGETTGPYHSFLVSVVVPHADLFAQLIRAGEVIVGISLLLGLVTRAGALGGMFLALNYMLAKGALGEIDTYGGLDFSAFVFSFINLVLPTAAVWSVDALQRRGRRRR